MLALLGAALTGGCPSPSDLEPPVQEATGQLGHGSFRWGCVDGADPTCGTGVFPTMVALGSRFELGFIPSDALPSELGETWHEPVGTRWLSYDQLAYTTLAAGDASIVALGQEFAVDYISLAIRPVDALIVGEPDPIEEPCTDDLDGDGVCDGSGGVEVDPSVRLTAGEITTLRARAFHQGSDLAGSLPYTWESLTPGVLRISQITGRSAKVEALGEGVARISVQAGDYVQEFEYTVEPAPAPEDTTTDGETSGAETDDGTDDGTGSGGGGSATDGETSGSGSESGSESGGGTESSSAGSESGSSTDGDTDGGTSTTGGV